MTANMFRLDPTGIEARVRHVALVARQWLTPSYVRVRLGGDALADFVSLGADDHLRIFFPNEQSTSRDDLATAPSRELTPLAWGRDWLGLELVIHGDPGTETSGLASTWAATAPLGAPAGIGGLRYTPHRQPVLHASRLD